MMLKQNKFIKLIRRYVKLIDKILSSPVVLLTYYLNKLYITLRLSLEHFEILERIKETEFKEWKIIMNHIQKLKLLNTNGQYSETIRVLSAIMPDTYAKCYYLKKIYEEIKQ